MPENLNCKDITKIQKETVDIWGHIMKDDDLDDLTLTSTRKAEENPKYPT